MRWEYTVELAEESPTRPDGSDQTSGGLTNNPDEEFRQPRLSDIPIIWQWLMRRHRIKTLSVIAAASAVIVTPVMYFQNHTWATWLVFTAIIVLSGMFAVPLRGRRLRLRRLALAVGLVGVMALTTFDGLYRHGEEAPARAHAAAVAKQAQAQHQAAKKRRLEAKAVADRAAAQVAAEKQQAKAEAKQQLGVSGYKLAAIGTELGRVRQTYPDSIELTDLQHGHAHVLIQPIQGSRVLVTLLLQKDGTAWRVGCTGEDGAFLALKDYPNVATVLNQTGACPIGFGPSPSQASVQK